MLTPREQGELALDACADKAERVADFNAEAAAMFMRGELLRFGELSGETLVERAEEHGYRAHDRRAFGACFRILLGRNLARVIRSDLPRKHGHGTAGGRLYRAVV